MTYNRRDIILAFIGGLVVAWVIITGYPRIFSLEPVHAQPSVLVQ